jgi:hypothetical protein
MSPVIVPKSTPHPDARSIIMTTDIAVAGARSYVNRRRE